MVPPSIYLAYLITCFPRCLWFFLPPGAVVYSPARYSAFHEHWDYSYLHRIWQYRHGKCRKDDLSHSISLPKTWRPGDRIQRVESTRQELQFFGHYVY